MIPIILLAFALIMGLNEAQAKNEVNNIWLEAYPDIRKQLDEIDRILADMRKTLNVDKDGEVK